MRPRSYRKVAMLLVVAGASIALVYAQPPDARGEVAETALGVLSAVAVLIVQVNSNEHRGGTPGARTPTTPDTPDEV